MPDVVLTVLFPVVLFLLVAMAVTMLVRPSLVLRHLANPLQRNTPENRVQLRGLGLIFFLFALQPILGEIPPSDWSRDFRHNMLIALWASPFAVPILLWLLWRFSIRSFVRRAQIEGISEDPAWELRISLIFCSVLLLMVALASLLAVKGPRY
jgi:hypothetical protein